MTNPGQAMPDDDLLRLIALDADDLAIISAHVQDAVLRVEGHQLATARKAFRARPSTALPGKRQPAAHGGGANTSAGARRCISPAWIRCSRSASTGRPARRCSSLLAVRFEPVDAPSGDVVLDFRRRRDDPALGGSAGGGADRPRAGLVDAPRATPLRPDRNGDAPRHGRARVRGALRGAARGEARGFGGRGGGGARHRR